MHANKYKTANKSGPQEIDITSPSSIKVIQDYLIQYPNNEYLLMKNGVSLNDRQIREILRTEIDSQAHEFGIRAIRRLFATYIVTESRTNPHNFKNFAKKMGTSVEMLMNNYVQVEDDKDDDGEYHGIGSLKTR